MTHDDVGGYEWWLWDDASAIRSLGMTIGYGMIHEPLEAQGTLQRLAGAIRAELIRPQERPGGQVSVPEVDVRVGSDTTWVVVRGDAEVVSSAWRRLAEFFAGELPLENAEALPVGLLAVPRELVIRFGLTSLALAHLGDVVVDYAGDADALRAHLDPAAGRVRCIMSTNDPGLVGIAFASLRGVVAATPEPSRLRSPRRCGVMRQPPGSVLWSAVVPRTSDGAAAIGVMAQQSMRHVDPDAGNAGIGVSVVPVGPDMLATVTSSQTLAGPQRERVLRVIASEQAADTLVSESVESARASGPGLGRCCERSALGLGTEVEVSVASVRAALAMARSTLYLHAEPGADVPPGFDEVVPELESPSGRRFRSRAGGERLGVGSRVIERACRFPGAHGVRPRVDIERADLSELAAVLDDASGAMVLLDQHCRAVDIAPDTFRRERRLRRLLTERTHGVVRLRTSKASDPAPMRASIKARRQGLWMLAAIPVGIILFAVIMSFVDDLFHGDSNGVGEHTTMAVTTIVAPGEASDSPGPD